MGCELCGLDLNFYGTPSRHVEGVNICLGCWLQLNGSGYGEPNYRAVSWQFLTHGAPDTRRLTYVRES